jgi:hypothetical protein
MWRWCHRQNFVAGKTWWILMDFGPSQWKPFWVVMLKCSNPEIKLFNWHYNTYTDSNQANRALLAARCAFRRPKSDSSCSNSMSTSFSFESVPKTSLWKNSKQKITLEWIQENNLLIIVLNNITALPIVKQTYDCPKECLIAEGSISHSPLIWGGECKSGLENVFSVCSEY